MILMFDKSQVKNYLKYFQLKDAETPSNVIVFKLSDQEGKSKGNLIPWLKLFF